MAECYYVMTKFYKIEKEKVLEDFRQLLLLPNVKSDESLLEALLILKSNNIDFVDTLLCARAKIYDYEIFSFDQKVSQCTRQ